MPRLKIDREKLEARGSLKHDPARYRQALPKSTSTLRRDRYRATLERRILALSARLHAEAVTLVQLELSPLEFQQLQARINAGKVAIGCHAEACDGRMFCLVSECRTNGSSSEDEMLACVLPPGCTLEQGESRGGAG